MKTTVNGKAIVMGKNIKDKKKRRTVREVKDTKEAAYNKKRTEACDKECKEACEQRKEMEERLHNIVADSVILQVQNHEQRKALESSAAVIGEAHDVVSQLNTRLNDARATLEIFCGANLGVDLRHHYKKSEGNDFDDILHVHTPQQQVCAKAVARLASMLYTILTREL